MSTSINVTVVGVGPVAELLAQRIEQRADLKLVAVLAADGAPAVDTDCVVYLPGETELAGNSVAERITGWLRQGMNVVSPVPKEALAGVDLLSTCREGASTYHGSGGFQCSLITRFNRAFASITRDIHDIELIEELDLEASVSVDSQLPFEGYYAAGLHTLSEAIFGDRNENSLVTSSVERVVNNQDLRRSRFMPQDALERVVVRRGLGEHVVYDSIWTQRENGRQPLRYQLNTVSGDATGNVTITFHQEGNVAPIDHLACSGLLDAIRPVCASAPGVLHHDLEINRVKPEERL